VNHKDALLCQGEHGAPNRSGLNLTELINDWKVALQKDEGLNVDLPQPEQLLEQVSPSEGVNKIVHRLPLKGADVGHDIIALLEDLNPDLGPQLLQALHDFGRRAGLPTIHDDNGLLPPLLLLQVRHQGFSSRQGPTSSTE